MPDLNTSCARVKERIIYDQATGLFVWSDKLTSGANRKAGCLRNDGYIMIRLDGILYYAHRLAWLYMVGSWPDGVIDHIDGNRANNKFENLRDVTSAVNSQNQKKNSKRNKSCGLLGVQRNHGGWQAVIMNRGARTMLGTFKTPEEAHARYVQEKRILHQGCTL